MENKICVDSLRDVVDNTVNDYYYWLSVGSTGTTTAYATTYFNNLTIPASPNFPASTATRYIVNLPGEPAYTDIDAGNSTFVIKNINTTTILTRVAPANTLTANTYKIFPETADRRGCLEVHVGTGSNSAGDSLAFHGRFISRIISSSEFNSIETATYIDQYNATTSIKIYNAKIDMGIWDITSTDSIKVYNPLCMGDKVLSYITIINDDSTNYKWNLETYFNSTAVRALVYIESSFFTLSIMSTDLSGYTYFNSTIINRGHIYFTYST